MRWPSDIAGTAALQRGATLLLAMALAGCASSSSRQPWIAKAQLATLPGSSVQVVVPLRSVGLEYEPSQGARRGIGVGAAGVGLLAAVPIAGVLLAATAGGLAAAANQSREAAAASAVQSRSVPYLETMGDYALAPTLSTAFEKVLRTSPAYRDAVFLPPSRNAFKDSPLDAGSAQTTVAAWANVSEDEREAVVKTEIRIASPDKSKLWHSYSYRAATALTDLEGPALAQALRGQDAATQRQTLQAHWLNNGGEQLRKALDLAAYDAATQMAHDLGAVDPEEDIK